jgi:hypothetical protein
MVAIPRMNHAAVTVIGGNLKWFAGRFAGRSGRHIEDAGRELMVDDADRKGG